MSETATLRLSAVAGLVCGVLITLGGLSELALNDKTPATGVFSGIAPAFGLAFLVGLYLSQRGAAGRLGAVAFPVGFLSLALFGGLAYARNFILVRLSDTVVDDLLEGPARYALLLTALFTLLGTVLVGVALLRAGIMPRLATVLYMTGFGLVCLGFALPAPVVRTGHVIAGAGIVWLAAAIRARAADTRSPAVSLTGSLSG